jgi:hypothetical protein
MRPALPGMIRRRPASPGDRSPGEADTPCGLRTDSSLRLGVVSPPRRLNASIGDAGAGGAHPLAGDVGPGLLRDPTEAPSTQPTGAHKPPVCGQQAPLPGAPPQQVLTVQRDPSAQSPLVWQPESEPQLMPGPQKLSPSVERRQ